MGPDSSLADLYEWVQVLESDLQALKDVFPDALRPDRNRLIASESCMRVSLEIRLKGARALRPDAPPRSIRPSSKGRGLSDRP